MLDILGILDILGMLDIIEVLYILETLDLLEILDIVDIVGIVDTVFLLIQQYWRLVGSYHTRLKPCQCLPRRFSKLLSYVFRLYIYYNF